MLNLVVDLEQEIPNDRFEYRKMIVSLYDRSILHVYVKPDSYLEIQDIQEITSYINSLGAKKYRNIF
ncbi:MAG TPA: hypothetical protein VD905_10805, partial [Flavobacteriales bacterium]|nr:hypothetical protein [Flavobacteriales bacterium]